jgi:hypothetical protein
VDLGTVAIVAVVAGLAGGAMGAALVGTVERMLRQRQTHKDRGMAREWLVPQPPPKSSPGEGPES